jgi:hypothetical protein
MRIFALIFPFCAVAAIAAGLVAYSGSSPAPSGRVSSIIVPQSADEIAALHDTVQAELDLMESLLEPAAAMEPANSVAEATGAGLAREPEQRVAASWSEFAEYETVRDTRLAAQLAVAAAKPPTVIRAAPVYPGIPSLGSRAIKSPGVLTSAGGGSVFPSFREITRPARSGSTGPGFSRDRAVSLVRLVYHSIRNGYEGGQGTLNQNQILPQFLPATPGRIPAPAVIISFSHASSAALFAASLQSTKTHTHSGDVV